jgi:hypothetical protein
MSLSIQQITDRALSSISGDERQHAAVYIDPSTYQPGSKIRVGRAEIRVSSPTVALFLDMAPGANWGHPCRYLLVDATSGDVRAVDSEFPPAPEKLRLIDRGPVTEDWRLLTQNELDK